MAIIATDLDRTLLPNGEEKYDGTLPVFKKIIKQNKFKLIYITGRTLKQIKPAIHKYDLPWPDYILTNVGCRIYKFYKGKEKFVLYKKWFKEMRKNTPEWDKKKLKKTLKNIQGLRIQEKSKQDRFKISYYVDLDKAEEVLKKVKSLLKKFKGIQTIYSVDYPEPRGLLDIMPKKGSKKGALDYLIKNIKERKEDVIYCGDSGNDLPLVSSQYKSILVKNSPESVKKQAKNKKQNKNQLYVSKKQKELNGNYVSGILQGLIYFKLISKKEVLNLVKRYREKENKFRE